VLRLCLQGVGCKAHRGNDPAMLMGEGLLSWSMLRDGFVEHTLDPFCGEEGRIQRTNMMEKGTRHPHGSLLQLCGKSECAISHHLKRVDCRSTGASLPVHLGSQVVNSEESKHLF